jgi:hypothetical protein
MFAFLHAVRTNERAETNWYLQETPAARRAPDGAPGTILIGGFSVTFAALATG